MTKRIKVFGMVQGVGFRPLVYRLAKKCNATGTVRNVGGYVEIILKSDEAEYKAFLEELTADKESGYEIVKLETEEIPDIQLTDFTIIGSGESEKVSVIPPDLPVCSKCQSELYEVADRRFMNPFISCYSCGPRYTIIEELPYDRNHTTMIDYKMCTSCNMEYTTPVDRRFHAQTISCNDCGPYLILYDKREANTERKNSFLPDVEDMADNKIRCSEEATYAKNCCSANTTDTKNCCVEDTDGVKNCCSDDTAGVKHCCSDDTTGVKHCCSENIAIMKYSYYEKVALDRAVSIIKSGGILAVKGIGGYHLVCTPFSEETVCNLRKLKVREEKPFAVMFDSMTSIKNFCEVSDEEEALLLTQARPIVLLYMHTNTMAPSTNQGSLYCGAFLPYTPLQILLTKQCGPLIMTSANISDQPIIREDEVMLSMISPYLDGVLYNTRRIMRSVDDSVAKVIDGKPQLIRRSRGYVPYPVFLSPEHYSDVFDNQVIFAAGGDLKAAFCLYQNGSAVVSQHFGDLGEVSTFQEYKNSLTDLSSLLKLSPTLAICDMHPHYYSSEFAQSLGIPVIQVQHHHAHITSVIAEHALQGKVIGIAFDGTGYGTDGCVWGSEFMICEGSEYTHAAQLKYTVILGGDESMKDAQKTATCFLLSNGLEEYVTDERKVIIKAALEHRINTVMTSSMGRLFDAVASILGVGQVNSYEGECAALLERMAVLAIRDGKEPEELYFVIDTESKIIMIDPRKVLKDLCSFRKVKDIGSLALGFHYALAQAIGEVCEKLSKIYHSNIVALSGGVFQNIVLTERALLILRQKGFEVYINHAVPPNDGAISLGQTYIGLKKLQLCT